MTDREYQEIAERFAEEDYDAWLCGDKRENVDDWMASNAADYVQHLAMGGDMYHAAMRNMRKDCIYSLADDMGERVREHIYDQSQYYEEA
jgi:hypothetical protein